MKEKLINDQISINARQNNKINMGYFYCAFAVSCQGFANFLIKFYSLYLFEIDAFSFNFWRTIVLMPISYYLIKPKDQELIKISEIKNRKWFFIRVTSNFVVMISLIYSLHYIRLSTVQCFHALNPIVVIILCSCVLNEKFYFRYLIAVILGLLGSILIILNDKKAKQEINETKTFDTLIGIFLALLGTFNLALLIISNKVMVNEKISAYNQIFYIGLNNTLLASVFILFRFYIQINFFMIIGGIINGAIYAWALNLYNKGLQSVELSKVSPMSYFSIVTVFILGVIVIKEQLYFTDILGSLIIVASPIYNSYYPINNK